MTSFDKQRIAELERENQELREQMQTMATQLSWMNTYHTGGMQAVIERGKQAEDRASMFERDLYRFFERYNPLISIELSARNEVKELSSSDDIEPNTPGMIQFETKEPGMFVGYAINSLHPIEGFKGYAGMGMFIGTPTEFKAIIDKHIHPALWNAPTLDDLRGGYMDIYGIDQNRLHAAVASAAMYWHDDLLREQWDSKLDSLFKAIIEPHLTMPAMRTDARHLFGKIVRKTYEAMAKKEGRNIRGDRPQSKPGKRSKD